MSERRVAIVAGARTPFVKARTAFAQLGPLGLAKSSVTGLLERFDIDPAIVQAIAYGAVVPEPGSQIWRGKSCLRVASRETSRPKTISSYCITGLRTITSVVDAIARGRIDVGIAGGVEWLSGGRSQDLHRANDWAIDGSTHGDHSQGI